MAEFSPDEITQFARLAGSVLRGVRKLFPITNTRDLPVCNTRILREGRGLPWNRRVAVHPTGEGVINVKAISIDD